MISKPSFIPEKIKNYEEILNPLNTEYAVYLEKLKNSQEYRRNFL